MSCLSAKIALRDKKFINKTKLFTQKQRQLIIKAFKKTGIKVFPSQANNILIRTKVKKFRRFLDQNQISMIDASCFRDIPKGCFRLSVRTAKKNNKLISLLQKGNKLAIIN